MTNFFNDTFIIAEIGGNHEGDFNYAKKLLLDAVESGVDAVKFQTYVPEKIVNKYEDPNRFEHFGKFCLKDDEYIELAQISNENNVIFMSSVWDEDSLELLDPYIQVHKVGSGDMTNYPLIKKIIKKSKPLIISTAMSSLNEIHETVNFILDSDPDIIKEGRLGILQCVAMYGVPKDEYANLRVINTLINNFPDAVIGYSDHTLGSHACNIAVGMGARILEIHFTDDKTRDFRDHHLSIDKHEMMELVSDIRKTEVLLGSSIKVPVDAIETKDRIKEFRRACYLKRDLSAGEIVAANDLNTLRPNSGIDSRDYIKLIGKRIKKDISEGEKLQWSNFEDA